MSDRQTVTIEIDAGEMFGSQSWSTYRRDIDEHGALNIGDGFGLLGVKVSGRDALRLKLREDRMHHVVLEVFDATTNEKMGAVELELYGLVPPRRGSAPKKDRRFGLDDE